MTFQGDTNGTATINGLHHNKAFQYDYYTFCPNSSGTNNNTVFALHLNFYNIKFLNCYTPQFTCGSTTQSLGGGIMLRNDPGSKLFVDIKDCEFINCQAVDSAGANNHGRSASGGAIFIDGRSVSNLSDSSVVSIHNCSFLDNKAVQLPNGGHGGAICLVNVSEVSVTSSSFCSNYVFGIQADNGDLQYDRNAGGAIIFYDQYNTNPGHQFLIDSCVFINNSATTTSGSNFAYNSEGGGVFLTRGDNLSGVCNASLTISNSQFTGNYIETGVEHFDNNSGTVTSSNNILSTGSSIQLLGDDVIFCDGDSETFSVIAAGFDILWSNGSTASSITVYDSDTIWVSVSNGGCAFSDTVIATKVYPMQPPPFSDTLLCPFASIIVEIPNTYSNFYWNDGYQFSTRFLSTPGTYFYTATDVNGCAVGDTFTIANHNEPGFLAMHDTVACNMSEITLCLSNHDGLKFIRWSNGDTAHCKTFNAAGIAFFTYEGEGGCQWQDSISIAFAETKDAYLEDTVSCCFDSCLAIKPTYSIVNPIWNNADTSRVFLPSKSGSYTVLYGGEGCRISETIRFNFIDCDTVIPIVPIDTSDSTLVIIPEEPCDTNIANVFTPDGDEINEFFRPWDPRCEVLQFMLIFNRWGEKIAELEDSNIEGWNGFTRLGARASQGTYFYRLVVEVDGEVVEKRGSLSLFR